MGMQTHRRDLELASVKFSRKKKKKRKRRIHSISNFSLISDLSEFNSTNWRLVYPCYRLIQGHRDSVLPISPPNIQVIRSGFETRLCLAPVPNCTLYANHQKVISEESSLYLLLGPISGISSNRLIRG